jgi:hypothetical protein
VAAAREAFAGRRWLRAAELFEQAAETADLTADDLEKLGLAAFLAAAPPAPSVETNLAHDEDSTHHGPTEQQGVSHLGTAVAHLPEPRPQSVAQEPNTRCPA